MKNTIKNIFAYTLPFSCIFGCIGGDSALSARNSRRVQKSVLGQYARSSGSSRKTTKSDLGQYAHPSTTTGTTITCGKNAQKNSAGTACECTDPENYIVNAEKTTECIQKTTTNAIAQRKACGQAFIKEVENKCSQAIFNNGIGDDDIKCYDANDLYLKIDTSNTIVYINGMPYEYDKICYAFTEDWAKSASDDYQVTGEKSPACKRARAIAEGSSACFQAVLSAGKATGAVDAIKDKLEGMCGVSGLRSRYAQMFGTEEVDKKAITFPTDLPKRYINAGKLSPAQGVEIVSNYLDGKITDKSNEWERDITKIVNSDLSLVKTACGEAFSAQMHDENIKLSTEKSSLARAIDESGSAKGAQNWALGQLSVVIGENRTNKFAREGFIGGVKDEDDTGSSVKSFTVDEIRDNNVETFIQNNKDTIKSSITSGDKTYHVFTTDDKYAIFEFSRSGSGSDKKIEWSRVDYNKDMKLPSSALKEMLGKTEETSSITGSITE